MGVFSGGVGGFIAEVGGFQTGGIRAPYEDLDLYNPKLTREDIDKLLGLYGELIDAARGSENKFLQDTFEEELSSFLVPLRAAYASSRERTSENLIRSGADQQTIARVMADLERGYGSQVSQGSRQISTGQARRKERFPFDVGQLTGTFLTNQQLGAQAESMTEQEWDMMRMKERSARRSANASQVRRIINSIVTKGSNISDPQGGPSYGLDEYGYGSQNYGSDGGGGGMGGMMGGGGGGNTFGNFGGSFSDIGSQGSFGQWA